jgi:hypothetical protein
MISENQLITIWDQPFHRKWQYLHANGHDCYTECCNVCYCVQRFSEDDPIKDWNMQDGTNNVFTM